MQNLHTHTDRCGHASGTEEQYVLAAVEGGLETLGFSDHTPYAFPKGYISKVRMKPEQLQDYVRTVGRLRKKYKDTIRILTGVEAEYYPAYFEQTRQMLADAGVEYMILGQHWIDNEIDAHRTSKPTDDEHILKKYCHQVLEAMQTGYFTYLCHPDVINFVGDPKIYEAHMRRLCREANACAMPVEYNLWGADQKKPYPYAPFWRIAAEEGCPVIIGIDAHRPDILKDEALLRQGLQTVTDLGMTVLDTCPIRKIY